MIAQRVRGGFRRLGIGLNRILPPPHLSAQSKILKPRSVDPIWPLPRGVNAPSDHEIHKGFEKYPLWHYAYKFEGGLEFQARSNEPKSFTNLPNRPLQRFRHFMPFLLDAYDGSLKGKRVLDIACNSGFWSMQCALLGADVVGFDARPELIEQANLIKSIVGINKVQYKLLDFWDMSPESLDGKFDIVLNLGILYHLPSPLEVLRLTTAMAKSHVLLDTAIYPRDEPLIRLKWEEPFDIRATSTAGIISFPSPSAMDLMFKHLQVSDWFEIPLHTGDMPRDYQRHGRASWLVKI